GIAVNDHFGPNNNDKNLSDRVRDSGKILVMAEHATLDAYTAAFTRGSLFAIQDAGAKKGNYPVITSISEDTTALTITLASDDATVQWIANGAPIAAGAILPMRAIPAGSLYVRAVVTNTAGSRVFTQAFKLRLRGDVDGNGILDAADTMVCAGVKSRLDVNPDHIAACQYR
ncbi:MAG: hypothetical protein JWM95_5428, partial [Gemmatimonadetes bacterium]|nr:hypothetical protein [Gemmatimonadota bacterium]